MEISQTIAKYHPVQPVLESAAIVAPAMNPWSKNGLSFNSNFEQMAPESPDTYRPPIFGENRTNAIHEYLHTFNQMVNVLVSKFGTRHRSVTWSPVSVLVRGVFQWVKRIVSLIARRGHGMLSARELEPV